MKKRVVKLVSILLLASFAWLFFNQVKNSHTHLVGGQIITHAHPYTPEKQSDSPIQTHKHLPSVAFFYEQITTIQLDSFGYPPIHRMFQGKVTSLPEPLPVFAARGFGSAGIGRSPPQAV